MTKNTSLALRSFLVYCLGLWIAHRGGLSWEAIGGMTLIAYSYLLDARLCWRLK